MSEIPPPRANPDLVGHEGAERALLEAWAGGRLHHAWMLTGPRGIGKATLAFRFARFLLASGSGETASGTPPVDGSAGLHVDPEEPLFTRVASGGHADLITVERRVNEKTGRLRSEIVAEDVRAVTARLAHTPGEGGWRVVVVDAAEEMNRNAANALLKVLEEPPARTVLLLVSHAPGQLLPTIRSRCRTLAMKPLADETVAAVLRRTDRQRSDAECRSLAALSAGSVGSALALAEEGGLALHDALTELLASLPDLDVAALDRLGDKVNRPGAERTFALAAAFYRGWLCRLVRTAATGGADESAGEGDRERVILARLAPSAGLDRWLEVWEKTTTLLARAESANLDRKQVVLTLFLTLMRAVRP